MGTLGWQEPINKQVFKASFSGSGEYKIKAKQLADELNRVRILPREHAREVFTKIFGILSRTNPEAMHHIRRLEQAMKILGIGKVREGKL